MATKVIEARAKITAEDATGATFSAVSQKLRGLEATAAHASRTMDSVARGMSSVGSAAMARAGWHNAISRGMGGGFVATSAAAATTASFGARARAAGAVVRDRAAEFASYALPGAAGSMLGMGGAAVGGLAIGGAGAFGLHRAISFEAAMADVKKKITLDAGATWDDVEAMINRTSRALGISREDMAALAAQAGQAGIAYKDLSEFMLTAAKASSAWDMSAKDSAQTLSEIKAQTSWANKELADFANKVNYLGDVSAAAEKNIPEMWGRASAGAKAAGVSYDDSMVALTAMKSVGMEQEVAARAFGQFSSRLRTATTQNKDFAAAAKAMGYTPKQLEASMKKDGMGTILTVLDKIGKSKDAVKLATGLGGKEWWDEFLRMKDARPEMTRLRGGLADRRNWDGSIDKSLEQDLATAENHLKRFGVLTSEIGDKLTRWALPSINDQIEKSIKLFEKAQANGAPSIIPDITPKGGLSELAGYTIGGGVAAGALGFPLIGSAAVATGVGLGSYVGGKAAYNVYSGMPTAQEQAPSGWLENAAAAFDRWSGIDTYGNYADAAARMKSGWTSHLAGGARSGLLGFGVGGPVGPALPGGSPVAKLEGAANINLEIKVSADKESVVNDVVQRLTASGALKTRDDVGTTMAR